MVSNFFPKFYVFYRPDILMTQNRLFFNFKTLRLQYIVFLMWEAISLKSKNRKKQVVFNFFSFLHIFKPDIIGNRN